ncbi:105aa long hypothetical protein [Pyrococcus horikoshii OT3]|uniref:Uncharacterized protein n=1 Tax=Pyrococcus horikoshii (strain ATCC 700860 / DSM 12428 / JCM 9974 / NBRC 100139 / OT-3) TaxID=70601 RepID=O58165_PYRHO|nr:105aa long hypothetical protein [Pyrococcus horikoshii OT3]
MGTVIMMKSHFLRSSGSFVGCNRFRFISSSLTSSMYDFLFLRLSIFLVLMSYPITLNFFEKATAKGNPTYPKPTIPIIADLSLIFFFRLSTQSIFILLPPCSSLC